MLKVLVFRYFFWFVLSVVFITGASRISVFGLGYLLGCFFFLLFGTQLLVKRSRTRLILWDCLIIYNVAVIISKSVLSVSVTLFHAPPPPDSSLMCVCLCFRSWRVCLCLRCRIGSVGSSSSSAWSAQSEDTMTVSTAVE